MKSNELHCSHYAKNNMNENTWIGQVIVKEQEDTQTLDGYTGAVVNFAVRCTKEEQIHPKLYQPLDDKGLDIVRVQMVERWMGQYVEESEFAILVSRLKARDGLVEIGSFHLFDSFEDDVP